MHCTYNPSKSATYFCPHCDVGYCDEYTHREAPNFERCFVCGGAVTSLGSVHGAIPFWRRLDLSFKYPLSGQGVSLIIGASIIITLAAYMPFGWLVSLVTSGVFVKYCFSCLENSAYGDFKPVPVDEAFSGGVGLLFQLLGIVIVAAIGIGAIFSAFGTAAGSFASVIVVAGAPAILINFALSGSFANAINPVAMLSLMKTIGLPYGLLLGIIMIMAGSVGVINQLLAKDMSTISLILQSVVSNYYSIVVFHIMGYMIFQYQDRLGFSAREDYGEDEVERSEADILAVQIDIWIKEGEKEKALDLFNDAVSQFPNDTRFFEKCFNFLIETKELDRLTKYLPIYFSHLESVGSFDSLYHTFKRLRAMKIPFAPEMPGQKYRIAKMANQRGDHQLVVRLLNGFHKAYPEFSNVSDAVKCLASSLETIPEHAKHAEKFHRLSQELARKAAREKSAPPQSAIAASKFELSESIDAGKANIAETKTNEVVALDDGGAKDLPPIDFPGFTNK